jgi:hypothetical protein
MNDHIDDQSAALSHRERPQVANHIRSIQTQTLDALLRMEELMQMLVNAGGVRVQDEIQIDTDTLNQVMEEAPKRRGRK